MSALYLRRCL